MFVAGSFATQTLLVHQVAYLVDHGVPALAAASVVGVVGLASVAGKTGWGVLSDRFGRELAYTLAFACVLASVGALAVAGAWPSPVLPYVYAVLIGLGYAATAPLTPAVASDLFGGPRFPRIFGVLHAYQFVRRRRGRVDGGLHLRRDGKLRRRALGDGPHGRLRASLAVGGGASPSEPTSRFPLRPLTHSASQTPSSCWFR